MNGIAGAVLSRLPLTEAVLSLLSFAIEPELLDQIFAQHGGAMDRRLRTLPSDSKRFALSGLKQQQECTQ